MSFVCRSCNLIDLVQCSECSANGCKHHVTEITLHGKRSALCFECVAELEEIAKGVPSNDEGEFL